MRTSSGLTFIVLTWAAVILASCAPEVVAQSPPSPMCAGTPMEGALADVDADDGSLGTVPCDLIEGDPPGKRCAGPPKRGIDCFDLPSSHPSEGRAGGTQDAPPALEAPGAPRPCQCTIDEDGVQIAGNSYPRGSACPETAWPCTPEVPAAGRCVIDQIDKTNETKWTCTIKDNKVAYVQAPYGAGYPVLDDACNRQSSRDACGPVKTSVETHDSLQCDLCWRLYVKERRWDPAEGRRLTVCMWGSMLTATKTRPKTLALAGTCKWVERPALPGTWGYSPPTPGLCAPAGDGTEACVGTCDPAKLDPSKACAKVPIRSKCEPQIIP